MKEDKVFVDVMPLQTRERTAVLLDGEPLAFPHWSSWWEIWSEDQAMLVECLNDEMSSNHYYLFDAQNQVQLTSYEDLNPNASSDYEPPNEMVKQLLATPEIEGRIWITATIKDQVYYVQRNVEETQANLYRININGNDRKLLREKTNIFALDCVGGKLFAHAYNPSVSRYSEGHDEMIQEIGIYLLDEEGKHVQTLLRYWDDLEGNSGYGFYGYNDLLVVSHGVIYSPSEFTFLYDPKSGATFPREEALSWDESSEHYYCPC